MAFFPSALFLPLLLWFAPMCSSQNSTAISALTAQPVLTTTMPTSSTNTSSSVNGGRGYDMNVLVGLLFPTATAQMRQLVGFGQSAPAINLAMKQAESDNLIPNVNFSFVWYLGDCNETGNLGHTLELIQWYNVDVIIGPPCNTADVSAGVVAGFYNIPILTWGADAASDDPLVYPTMMSTDSDTFHLGLAIRALLNQYNWSDFAFIYTTDPVQLMCANLATDIEAALDAFDQSPNIVYKFEMQTTEASIQQTLNDVSSRARIVVTCFDNSVDLRNFMIYANGLGMNDNDEYVYIFPSVRSEGMTQRSNNGTPVSFWVDPNDPQHDGDAQQTAMHSLVVDFPSAPIAQMVQFTSAVMQNMGAPPFYCNGSCLGDPTTGVLAPTDNGTSTYASTLYDTFYMYAMLINNAAQSTGLRGVGLQTLLRNGSYITTSNISQMQFQGINGLIVLDSNGTRVPQFCVTGLDGSLNPTIYLNITISGYDTVVVNELYTNEAAVWANWQSKRPLATPVCGYTGTDCPPSATLYVAIGGGLVLLCVIIALTGIIYALRQRRREQDRLRNESLIAFSMLRRIDPKAKSAETLRSHASLRSKSNSSHSNSAATLRSNDNSINADLLETENHAYFIHSVTGEVIFSQKFAVRVPLTTMDIVQVRQLREFDHDNVNKLLGLCIDSPQLMAVWKYCHRGSLQDAIVKGDFISDPFVAYALMRDIVNGLKAIHTSSLEAHGRLTSQCCLVNDRWQLKIGDYGLGMINDLQPARRYKQLWRAPEHLRADDRRGSKEGDIYSFAIICSELVNREKAWENAMKDSEINEIVYRVKRGSEPPFRPKLKAGDDEDTVNPALLHLIRDCWSEYPGSRPPIKQVGPLLKQMVKKSDQNLMDYVFGMLEVYAGSLEQEVKERTKELVEEKRKSDLLLYRMLPRLVADKLRIGESVAPEQYAAATVFFSDVVSFTTLASRCTPLQVVQLLNDLYSTFDNIIDMHDAYKVETIGDGYLIVSGIPHRNGDAHAKEIAELALDFMRVLPAFRIPHLPGERVNLRIGVHTGPAVAGVVGLTMPRYCLFGDTVNTASRMESNGRPGAIHISPTTNHYLTNIIGGYVTELRGEVIVKGKGVMETYWLIGKGEMSGYGPAQPSQPQPRANAGAMNPPPRAGSGAINPPVGSGALSTVQADEDDGALNHLADNGAEDDS